MIFIYVVMYNFSLETDLMLDYQEVSFSGSWNNPISGKKSVIFLPADMVSSFKVSLKIILYLMKQILQRLHYSDGSIIWLNISIIMSFGEFEQFTLGIWEACVHVCSRGFEELVEERQIISDARCSYGR